MILTRGSGLESNPDSKIGSFYSFAVVGRARTWANLHKVDERRREGGCPDSHHPVLEIGYNRSAEPQKRRVDLLRPRIHPSQGKGGGGVETTTGEERAREWCPQCLGCGSDYCVRSYAVAAP